MHETESALLHKEKLSGKRLATSIFVEASPCSKPANINTVFTELVKTDPSYSTDAQTNFTPEDNSISDSCFSRILPSYNFSTYSGYCETSSSTHASVAISFNPIFFANLSQSRWRKDFIMIEKIAILDLQGKSGRTCRRSLLNRRTFRETEHWEIS